MWTGGGFGGGMGGMRGGLGGPQRAWDQVQLPTEKARFTGAGTLRHSDFDDEVTGKIYDHAIVSRLAGYFLRHGRLLLLALVGMVLYQVTYQYIPNLIQRGVDAVTRGDLNGLNQTALLFLMFRRELVWSWLELETGGWVMPSS
jgi:hypothetical protein